MYRALSCALEPNVSLVDGHLCRLHEAFGATCSGEDKGGILDSNRTLRTLPLHAQDILEDLFLECEVDLVLTGHVHLYARTCSVKRDRCVGARDGGIMHITLGASALRMSCDRARQSPLLHVDPATTDGVQPCSSAKRRKCASRAAMRCSSRSLSATGALSGSEV